ncbi:hypothetical protein HDV06_000584 [Boothiomyces sp. JEL0866]|nr:hypothetical protein HDV06_000584 [Boothiomyces sp. JEL0866]
MFLRRSRLAVFVPLFIVNTFILLALFYKEQDHEVSSLSVQQPLQRQIFTNDIKWSGCQTCEGCRSNCSVEFQIVNTNQPKTKWENGYSDVVHQGIGLLPTKESLLIPQTNRFEYNSNKFFYESPRAGHLDIRFEKMLNKTDQLLVIKEMFKAFAEFCDSIEMPYWIMHGSLLGWKFGGKTMPFDDDIDVQVLANNLFDLEIYQNKTIGGHYILEVNPHHVVRTKQIENVIDARFIDTRNGHFIDITGVTQLGNYVTCKSPHYYKFDELFPLVRTVFEGVPTWRPNNYERLLSYEYRSTSIYYKQFRFNDANGEWELYPIN